MALQLPSLAVYPYNHGGRVLLSKRRKLAFVVSLIVSLAVVRLLFPFGLLALLVPTLVYMGGERTLKIGRRYLIAGDRIIYYANVKRLTFAEAEGRLTLRSGLKTEYVIERKRFKTKSRREADFGKVVAEISQRVQLASPDALKAEEDRDLDAED